MGNRAAPRAECGRWFPLSADSRPSNSCVFNELIWHRGCFPYRRRETAPNDPIPRDPNRRDDGCRVYRDAGRGDGQRRSRACGRYGRGNREPRIGNARACCAADFCKRRVCHRGVAAKENFLEILARTRMRAAIPLAARFSFAMTFFAGAKFARAKSSFSLPCRWLDRPETLCASSGS